MSGEKASGAGEALLRRMQRLLARAATVGGSDRKQLLALLDDVETTRRGLLQECAAIEAAGLAGQEGRDGSMSVGIGTLCSPDQHVRLPHRG